MKVIPPILILPHRGEEIFYTTFAPNIFSR